MDNSIKHRGERGRIRRNRESGREIRKEIKSGVRERGIKIKEFREREGNNSFNFGFRFIDKGIDESGESGEGFNGEEGGIDRDRIGRDIREEGDKVSDGFSVNGIGFRGFTGDVMEVMDFGGVNDREIKADRGDSVKEREVISGSRFSSDESRVFWEGRDKVNEIVDTGKVIREGEERGGVRGRGFNSDGEGIFGDINTNKVGERVIDMGSRLIIGDRSHKESPPYIKISVKKAKRGEVSAPDSILPDDTGKKAQSTYREKEEQGTDSFWGIKAQDIMSSPAPLFALKNIIKTSKNSKHSYLIIYKIFS